MIVSRFESNVMTDSGPVVVMSEAPAVRPSVARAAKWLFLVCGAKVAACALEFCPTRRAGVKMKNDHPYPANPDNCTACHWCDTHCPDLAIVVKPLA